MKRILCYGDSNTWGQAPYRGRLERLEHAKQWPNILQKLLGEQYWVAQEGLPARVAGSFDTDKPYRNGQDSFEVVYYSASPVDLVIISLGTNDLHKMYGRSARDAADDLLWYWDFVQQHPQSSQGKATKVLYLCPANFTSGNGVDISPEAREQLLVLMRTFEAPIIELNDLPLSDGLHYAEEAHQMVAKLVKEKVEEMLV